LQVGGNHLAILTAGAIPELHPATTTATIPKTLKKQIAMKALINHFWVKYKLSLIGMAAGAIGGYLYYYFIGCEESCTITSNPVNSSLYGALMGGLLFNILKKEKIIKP